MILYHQKQSAPTWPISRSLLGQCEILEKLCNLRSHANPASYQLLLPAQISLIHWPSASEHFLVPVQYDLLGESQYFPAPSPLEFVLFAHQSGSVLAIVVALQEQTWRLLVAPLQHLVFWLAVGGVHVLEVPCLAVQGVCDEAKVPFLILLKAHWYDTYRNGVKRRRGV